MRGARHLHVGCLLAFALVLGGCVNLNKSYPEKRSFVVDVTPEGRKGSPDSTVVLKVAKFHVSPLFIGRAMVYRTGELQYESDFYDEWFVTPGTMLTQEAQEWVSKRGRFQFVQVGTNHVEPTHLIEGTVTEFYGDYRLASQPKAVLGLELRVVDDMQARPILFQRSYHQEVPLADRSPDALARGLTEALRSLLSDFERDLDTVDLHATKRSSSP
jgi:cholesterol transport system auxiliary component